MVTKGIIYQVLSPYSAKVRLPFYDQLDNSKGGTSDENLSTATLCALPNTTYHLEKGDIVWVDFEDNDISKPVIIGLLQKGNGNIGTVDLSIHNIKANNVNTSVLNIDNFSINKNNKVNSLTNFSNSLSLLTQKNNDDILGLVINANDDNLYKVTTKDNEIIMNNIPTIKEIVKEGTAINYIKLQLTNTINLKLNNDGTFELEEI